MLIALIVAAAMWVLKPAAAELRPPSSLAAASLSPTSVSLSWSDTSRAASYIVQVGADPMFSETLASVETDQTTLTVEGLPASYPGTDRYYRVQALHGDQRLNSRTARFAQKPAKVSKVRVAARNSAGVQVTWKRAKNARQYDVVLARDKKFTKIVTSVRTAKARPKYTTSALKPATAYWLKVRPVNGEETATFSNPVAVETQPRSVSFTVGTWNVCADKCPDYARRAANAAEFLNANQVDLFGLQEGGGKRLVSTTEATFSGGSQEFSMATGGDRSRYIFYRPALFEQLDGGSFDIGDGRDTTWAKFRLRANGRAFFVVDVHLENGKDDADGKRAREAERMVAQIAQFNQDELPVIYLGDFNSGPHRGKDSPGAIMRRIGLDNSLDVAQKAENRQYNTGHTMSPTILSSGAHVDHIFVSKHFEVSHWKQLMRVSGNGYLQPLVSDHNPLTARVSLATVQDRIGSPTQVAPLPIDTVEP